jgi:hypothetical protein
MLPIFERQKRARTLLSPLHFNDILPIFVSFLNGVACAASKLERHVDDKLKRHVSNSYEHRQVLSVSCSLPNYFLFLGALFYLWITQSRKYGFPLVL